MLTNNHISPNHSSFLDLLVPRHSPMLCRYPRLRHMGTSTPSSFGLSVFVQGAHRRTVGSFAARSPRRVLSAGSDMAVVEPRAPEGDGSSYP